MISLLNSSLERVAIIKNLIKPWRYEQINGENTLEFTAILDEKVSTYADENAVVEFGDDYFDVVYYSKDMNEDGTCTMAIECEHTSYRLNDSDYDLDEFAETGTPTAILTAILSGTGFTVGTVELTTSTTYAIQEKKSRRALLMEFIALIGGEVSFNKFEVSILTRRGTTDLQIFTKGKNIKVLSKVYDGRESPAQVAYTCTPIILPDKAIDLGDDVLLVQPELDISDTLRVVSIGYNPIDSMEQEIEIANYINTLEDQLYRIETTTVAKEKIYNGCKIGPDEGFTSERSDSKVKTTMNATEGFKLESDIGDGLVKVFYVGTDGIVHAVGLMIQTSGAGGRIELTPDNDIKIYSSDTGAPLAFIIDYDTNGAGTDDEAAKRIFLRTQNNYALKIEANAADISIQAKGTGAMIWLMSKVTIQGDLDMSNNDILNIGNVYTKSEVASEIADAISAHVSAYHSGP